MNKLPGGGKLLLSMSGGRTSAYMTEHVLRLASHLWDEIIVVFANTGQEHEATLEFINNCDNQKNFKTVWVEAVVSQEKGVGTKHKVVNFQTAARNGEPFEEVIKKYGIPNLNYPHCTRELKLRPIESYVKSLGWGKDYFTAIGIRPDEMRRVNKKAVDAQIVYPMIDWFYSDKSDVIDWWSEQPFDLELEEHQGNCTWCWKKSFSKHARLLNDSPDIYLFPEKMENKYGMVGPEQDSRKPREFFRGKRSTSDLRDYCKELNPYGRTPKNDEDSGCGESCELFPTVPINYTT